MGILDLLFGKQNKKVQEYLDKGAILLDVRTKQEWNAGHIKKAIHIPLDQLNNRLNEVKKLKKPIIVYCASGVRSGKAAKFLSLNNIEAINGGGVNSLSALLN